MIGTLATIAILLLLLGGLVVAMVLFLYRNKQNDTARRFVVDRLLYYGRLDNKTVDEILRIGPFAHNHLSSPAQVVTKTFSDNPRLRELEVPGKTFDSSKPVVIYIMPLGFHSKLECTSCEDHVHYLINDGFRVLCLLSNAEDIWNWIDPETPFPQKFGFEIKCDQPESMCSSSSGGQADQKLISDAIAEANGPYILFGYSAGAQMVSFAVSEHINDSNLKGAILAAGGGQYCYINSYSQDGTLDLSNMTEGEEFFTTCVTSHAEGCCPVHYSLALPDQDYHKVPPLLLLQTFNDNNADFDAARNMFNSAIAFGAPNVALVMDGGDKHGVTERQKPVMLGFCRWIAQKQ